MLHGQYKHLAYDKYVPVYHLMKCQIYSHVKHAANAVWNFMVSYVERQTASKPT